LAAESGTRRVYFISDVHLGTPDGPREPWEHEGAVIAFLRHIRGDAEILYIVGDLFDFWFEYRSSVLKTGARVLFELYTLVESGTRVVYVPGNHDLWLGPYLSQVVGIETLDGPADVNHQGLRVLLAHGDEFRTDWRFHVSRGILKNRLCIAMFRLLHPDLGLWIARMTSGVSGFRARRRPVGNRQAYVEVARAKLADGFDVVVSGHYHRPMCENTGEGTLVILGDWLTEDVYAVLEGGEVRLRKWQCKAQNGKCKMRNAEEHEIRQGDEP